MTSTSIFTTGVYQNGLEGVPDKIVGDIFSKGLGGAEADALPPGGGAVEVVEEGAGGGKSGGRGSSASGSRGGVLGVLLPKFFLVF